MKNPYKNLLFILTATMSTAFLSCKDIDDYPTIIEGKIEDFYTNKRIPDYHFFLTATKSMIGGSIYYEMDTIKSDMNGEFFYSFTAENGYRYHIIAFDGKYQGYHERELDYETTNTIDLKVKELKTLSLQLKNKSGKYKRIACGPTGVFDFVDTTIIINRVTPGAVYRLKLNLFECRTCGRSIEKSERIRIKNIDTTYFTKEY